MAELETVPPETKGCCSPDAQETCCEPESKSECCGDHHGTGCGCSAGVEASTDQIRETVRERYAKAAVAAGEGSDCGCGGGAVITEEQREAFGVSALCPG